MPSNLYQWHFVIRLQELELVFGHKNGKTDGHTNVEVEIVI